MNNLAIITPSYITSAQRELFAKKSLNSLTENIKNRYKLIIVDDTPTHSTHNESFNCIYSKIENCEIIRRNAQLGSASATLEATNLAIKHNIDLVFIHLDDNIYNNKLKSNIFFAIDAFNKDKQLMSVRFTGFPLLTKVCTKNLGNQTLILKNENYLQFDAVKLYPIKRNRYTLWESPHLADMTTKKFWPIALWSTIYRSSFLKKLLTGPNDNNFKHLADAELFYKNNINWRNCINSKFIDGKIGYINMEYCGIEMEHNKNWKTLLTYPNIPII